MLRGKSENSLIENRQISWLASLRGLAVFLVFFSHLNSLHMPYAVGFTIGRIGVVIFFLKSGYLALGAKEKRSNKQYLINRFLRIYPIYWLMLLLRVMADKFQDVTVVSFVLNLTAFHEFFGVKNIIGASWMLPIMVIFFCLLCLTNKIGGVE